MTSLLGIYAFIIVVCVLLNNFSNKIGMPVLLAFIVLGMLFGNLSGMQIDNSFEATDDICSAALVFIMFYSGFGTNWGIAKRVAKEASLLASVGVVITAIVTGLFCHFVLRWGWLEAMLMGSVISSTDAASVFSILRSRKLGLKNNIAPMLEVESGSNDPLSNMLTVLFVSLMQSGMGAGAAAWMLLKQIALGAGLGFAIGLAAVYVMRHFNFATSGFDSLFVFAIALFSFAIPNTIGGNGYLSAYIVGIILGNSTFPGKKALVGFFDGVTNLMMVIIFFDLGLLGRPESLFDSILPALAIFFCLLLISRPIAIFSVLAPTRKYDFRQQVFTSFVGLRGAASVVFAIIAMCSGVNLEHDIFSIVFCIVLISIAVQGSFIPKVAEMLGVIDENSDVMKTFTDFAEETLMQFSEINITETHSWAGKTIMELNIPKEVLICMVIRPDGSKVIPRGKTLLKPGDKLVACSKAFVDETHLRVAEQTIEPGSKYIGRCLKEFPANKNQIVLIKRGDERIIPHGDTTFIEGDVLYFNIS